MKPLSFPRAASGRAAPCGAPALVEPGTPLPELLAALAARMTPEQSAAFLAKMAAMDLRRGALSAASVTLGRA